MHTLHYQLFGIRFDVICPCPKPDCFLTQYLVPWARRDNVLEVAPRIFEVTQHADRFGLRLDGHSILQPGPRWRLFCALQHEIDQLVLQCQHDKAFIHCGVVGCHGRALLLPGSSGAGKTTLVSALLQHGAVYLSDEYALLDARGYVHPYPRALMMRDARGRQRPKNPGELAAGIAEQPLPVGSIFFLRYQQAARFSVKQESLSQVLFQLLQHTPQILQDRPQLYSFCETAVNRLEGAFVGERGDANEAARAILAQIPAPSQMSPR